MGFTLSFGGGSRRFFGRLDAGRATVGQIYVKTGILVAVLVASYLLLLFAARTGWPALPLAILLGLAAAGIGFNVQHDGDIRPIRASLG
jgi:hypothetical protein